MDLFSTQNFVAFLTLAALEIVLGIDNVIFIAILAGKLPLEQRDFGRKLGIAMAVISRILLLLGISWIIGLNTPLFAAFGNPISGRDLILLAGGLFLIGKSTFEIHEKLEAEDTEHRRVKKAAATLTSVVAQILLIDVVFSLDSVITAIGIADALPVMIAAIVIAAVTMVFFSGAISAFVERHPSMKILALAFLILIGALLVIEGWNPEAAHQLHLKNYAYFAMAFSFAVELVNIRTRKPEPIHLHNRPSLAKAQEVTPTEEGIV